MEAAKQLLKRFRHSRLLHVCINALQIKRISHFLLSRRPIVRKLPHCSLYRIKSFESFPVVTEIFRSGAYDELLSDEPVTALIDLGCNTGYLALLLKERGPNGTLRGLLVDANPAMVEEAGWHMLANRLDECRTVWGVVGARTMGTAEFFLRDLHISSSMMEQPTPEIRRIATLKVTRKVPYIDVGQLWHADALPVDFLKMDIEGSEVDFPDSQAALLSNVRWLMIEWHKWNTSTAGGGQRRSLVRVGPLPSRAMTASSILRHSVPRLASASVHVSRFRGDPWRSV